MSRSALLITIGLMATLFMASMEGTVVATAMPTIVSQLGGLGSYSWVFSAFLVAATTTVPIFGKLSDLFGPRRVFAVAVALFLFGSLLCGLAQTMTGSPLREPTRRTADDTTLLQLGRSALQRNAWGFARLHSARSGLAEQNSRQELLRRIW